MNRRKFLRFLPAAGAIPLRSTGVYGLSRAAGTLDPRSIRKYQMPLVIPPAMPKTGVLPGPIDYYEIGVRQFEQQILPSPVWPKTKVWSYGAMNAPGTVPQGGSFNYPAFTIEARVDRPVRVRWINDLKDPVNGRFLPHLLPVDQTLHWANPPGPRDSRGGSPYPYTGPVPIVTHLHGGHTQEHSDGFPEAWYLPAVDLPRGINYATGTFYDILRARSPLGGQWSPGSAVFQYANDQAASTLWYHDHTIGMTRANVYAGPAGFYLLRGGPHDLLPHGQSLPGPAPLPGIMGPYFEIPIAIQDRSFNVDASLFYPDNRAFFEELQPPQLRIPFAPDRACEGEPSDVPPIWNPEFFGNVMVVNGVSWPFLNVEQRRYRFRFLNGCNSRFLILKFDRDLNFWQIGAEGGFLPEPVQRTRLLIGPAERADVIVDFTGVPRGTTITLLNLGPDEPFDGAPDEDSSSADPRTTGQIMEFRVIAATGTDTSTPPHRLVLPSPSVIPGTPTTRKLSLNEMESETVRVSHRGDRHGTGLTVLDCEQGQPFGPTMALLGTIAGANPQPKRWEDDVTENPRLRATEIWEMYNFTADAHPMHVHMVQFEVVDRQRISGGPPRLPAPWERGLKDTVIAFPGEITRIKAYFDIAGLFTWHCHIVEHEDNEMMRPYRVGSRL